jgi:hypothetical protein
MYEYSRVFSVNLKVLYFVRILLAGNNLSIPGQRELS